ncbi:MAG TPA: hypothetical protein VK709_12720 [Candidatus Saccharimonadales bacterium]|jgi:hypothetical protein|nr:hypothetical protein [Candidatus Saccharimonadales bacterium]
MATTNIQSGNEPASVAPVSEIPAQIVEPSGSPVGNCPTDQGQLMPAQSRPLGQSELEVLMVPPPSQGPLITGQPVFHRVFGYGTIAAIDGDKVSLQEKKEKAVTHVVKALDLITKSQAEIGFEACYFTGGAKAWRLAAGKWASLYKNLCLMEGKGAYGDWLKRHDLNRSSMDDLIRRFEEQATWEAQDLVLTESGKTDEANPALEIVTSVYSVTGARQVNEHTPDPENEERQKNIRAESSKREGIEPTHHKTILYFQRRHLDPEMLTAYYAIREHNKERVDTIMRRKIDEGVEEVLALDPTTLQEQPEVIATPSSEKSDSTITEEIPPQGHTTS